MKLKTLLELATLSTSIYFFAKENKILERFSEASKKDVKDSVNITSEEPFSGDESEADVVDRFIFKTSQLKSELEEKLEEMVTAFYKKVNIAHLDEMNGLKKQLDEADKSIALLEARLNKLEAKL